MDKELKQALENDDFKMVTASRREARVFMDTLEEGHEFADSLHEVLDDAQGEADEAGKVSYVVIKITGETL